MKKVILIINMLLSLSFLGQDRNIKTDTLFFSGKIPKISDSKMEKILSGVSGSCDPEQKMVFDNKIESNREFRTNSVLKLFNTESKTSIFTDADAVIVAYFCQNIDYINEIEIYEIIIQNEKLAQTLVEKLDFLKNKNGFYDYIGFKNWYFRKIGNKVYFIDFKEENSNNKTFVGLKANIANIR
jgi:hypothetical protein